MRWFLTRVTAVRPVVAILAGLGVVPALVVASPAWGMAGSRTGEAVERDVRQLITVTAVSHRSTYASLTAYRRATSRWGGGVGPGRGRGGGNGSARAGGQRGGGGRAPA